MSSKYLLKCLPPYFAVYAGLYLFHNAWAALLGFHVVILLILAIDRPNISPNILFKSEQYRWLLPNALLCSLSGLGAYYLHPLAGLSDNFKTQLADLGLTISTLPAFITYFSLTNPLLEEYFWRAFLGNDKKGFYIGDLLYAGYHALVLVDKVSLFTTITSIACLTFAGWFWRKIKREDEGLLIPVLGHMMADFSILAAVYWMIN